MAITACDRLLKSSVSHPGVTRGGSKDLDAGDKLCPVLEKEGPSSGRFTRERLSQGESGPKKSEWASRAHHQDLLLILPDLTQGLTPENEVAGELPHST